MYAFRNVYTFKHCQTIGVQGRQKAPRSKHYALDAKQLSNERKLKEAASEFAEAVQNGVDPNEIVAWQLGATEYSRLSEKQQEYVEKIKAKLEEKAEQARLEREKNSAQFNQGKRAYSRGQYDVSVVLFQEALSAEGEVTPLGGEIQMWLALAYQACGMEDKCIQQYKYIEKNHPVSKIRKQAYELRYIMEAPKLKIGDNERISLPLLEDTDRYVRGPKRTPKPPAMAKGKMREKTAEEIFWDNYTPPVPELVKNRYVQVASAILAVCLAIYSAVLAKQ